MVRRPENQGPIVSVQLGIQRPQTVNANVWGVGHLSLWCERELTFPLCFASPGALVNWVSLIAIGEGRSPVLSLLSQILIYLTRLICLTRGAPQVLSAHTWSFPHSREEVTRVVITRPWTQNVLSLLVAPPSSLQVFVIEMAGLLPTAERPTALSSLSFIQHLLHSLLTPPAASKTHSPHLLSLPGIIKSAYPRLRFWSWWMNFYLVSFLSCHPKEIQTRCKHNEARYCRSVTNYMRIRSLRK